MVLKVSDITQLALIGLFVLVASAGSGIAQPLPSSPLAAGLDKWLGCMQSGSQVENHEFYCNQVTPENGGKWGSVESMRDRMNWGSLDAAYEHAQTYRMPFRYHVLVWGSQQPGWISGLPQDEQLAEVEEWFDAVAERYPDITYLEVVNEPLHQPPSYKDALGGDGDTGWDWIITAFEMARAKFPPSTKLMINDYGMLNDLSAANRYRRIVELLQERDLIDGIGVQGHAFNTRPGSFNGQVVLDFLGATGLPIQVTEMDVDGNPSQNPNLTDDESDQNQLDDMQRIFPVLWEHPAVKGITFWGWKPGLWRQAQEAFLIDNQGNERPAMQWLREYMEQYRSEVLAAESDELPKAVSLVDNFPNPFNQSTRIRYTLETASHVRLTVFDLLGRPVRELVNAQKTPGEFEVTFDASGLESGVYLFRLDTDTSTETSRGLLVE